ncbi:MAG: DoxX family protein [Candidatus Limnocylindrales bacterium]
MLFPELGDLVDWGLLALRVAVGAIFIVHGWPKLTQARMMGTGMAQMSSMSPTVMTGWMFVQGVVEVGGSVLLIAGLWTQVVAIVFAVFMLGAIGLKNSMMKTGFMAQQSTGWEFDFILFFANLLLLLAGPGSIAILPSTVTIG